MRTKTRLEHEVRIEETVNFIVDHLDEALDLRDLADRACLSRFHFHRVFQNLIGETVGDMVRRLRLERAAVHLRTTETPITELAFEAGYATHEAFIKAFRSAYGCTPSTMRKRLKYEGRLPTPNTVHFGHSPNIKFVPSQGDKKMEIQIRNLPSQRAVCMAHSGPYFMIGQTFGALGAWLQGTQAETGMGIAFYYDDPEATPADQLRSDAGALVSEGFKSDDPRVHMVEMESGEYAVTPHNGPYDGLPKAWGDLMSSKLPDGYTYRNAPPFELYLNNCNDTPAEALLTELYVAVKK